MGDKAAAFYGENKIWRRRVAPGAKRFYRRQVIEAVVQLDGLEMLHVKVEHVRWANLLRIKAAQPMFIIPSRGPDIYSRIHSLKLICNLREKFTAGLLSF